MLLSIVNCNTIMLSGHLSVMLRAGIKGILAISALEADVAMFVRQHLRAEIPDTVNPVGLERYFPLLVCVVRTVRKLFGRRKLVAVPPVVGNNHGEDALVGGVFGEVYLNGARVAVGIGELQFARARIEGNLRNVGQREVQFMLPYAQGRGLDVLAAIVDVVEVANLPLLLVVGGFNRPVNLKVVHIDAQAVEAQGYRRIDDGLQACLAAPRIPAVAQGGRLGDGHGVVINRRIQRMALPYPEDIQDKDKHKCLA